MTSPELPQKSSAILMTSGDKNRSRGLPVGPPGARWVRVKAQSGVGRAVYRYTRMHGCGTWAGRD